MVTGSAVEEAPPGMITPGILKSARQPGDPSYQASSAGFNKPAANCRFTSSSGIGPMRS